MKDKKLAEMNVQDLEKELGELKSELFKLKFSLATNGLDNPLKVREVRRQIARVKTELRKRELNPVAEVKEEKPAKSEKVEKAEKTTKKATK